MRYCQQCVIPDTRPGEWGQKGGLFDEQGVCLGCRNHEERQNFTPSIWAERARELSQLADKYRRRDGYYDCVIPVSGGKDSYYLVYLMK